MGYPWTAKKKKFIATKFFIFLILILISKKFFIFQELVHEIKKIR